MEAERHTFLFTDLVGYTALAAAEGDDRAADVALDFARRVRGLASDFGAEVVKLLGDGLMLRSRHADDAMRLGLKIVDDLATVPDFPFVRVGMHTGPAVTRDGDWYGTTVNVAARLCGAASGGEVLVSDATAADAGTLRSVEVGEHRLHWLKNLSEPVGAHTVSPKQCDEGRLRRLRSLLSAKAARFQEAV